MSAAQVYDAHPCRLGEGALWHPGQGRLYWFDILSARLHWHDDGVTGTRQFDEMVSAAGWVDDRHLLVASETRLFLHDLDTGASETLAPLEADDPRTRSNDGRADPWGGFWISTSGKAAEPGAGAIYRYFGGEVRRLISGLTIPNAICFTAGGEVAHFADTPRHTIWRQPLRPADGWPRGDPESWLDLSAEGLSPDGAVCDADDVVWVALYGAGRVAAYAPDGSLRATVAVGAPHSTCPAFGGPQLTTLFCTSAHDGISPERLAAEPAHGWTFAAEGVVRGRAEPAVRP